MQRKHSWTALVALFMILIDSYAEEHFPNENKSTTNSDNNNNLLLKAPVNNKPSEFHVNEIDVIKEIAINSRKLNRFKDKKFVIANANGPVFSYPSSMEMKKDSDGRYLQTKDLSRSRLPLLYQPKDKKFFKLLNLLNLKNNSNKEHVLCKRLPVEYEISMRNISISIHHKILESTEYEKNKKKEQVKMSSNEKTLKPIKKNIPMKHHDLLSINKSIRNNVMKTSDTTFKLPLTVLTKFSSSPPCVKHETSLANEESRDKNQAIQPKQVREFQLDEEFSQIPATIKTSSDTTKFNNEKYTNNYYDEIMMTKYSNYYDKLKDVTSSFSSFSSSFVDKKITKINTRKKTPIKRMTREVSPNEIDEKLLFASNIERKKSFKIIASSFIDKNKLSNSTNGNISLPHYQNTSSINDQLKNHMKISLLNETDNISLISSMPDSKSSDVHEHLPTSIITSNSKSPSDANTSLTIKLYSGDYELDVDSARNIVPLETTARTIENLTSQTETVTLCDKKLLGMSGVSETITDIKFLENAIKPNLNWSISHDKVGPVISALSNNRKKLIVHNEEGVNADSEIPIGNETLEISAKNNDRIHHRILNSTLTVNNEHQTITNEYRLPIPLSNSQLDVIQSQTKIGNVKIQLNKVALSDKNIDNATVKSATAIQTQMQNKEWKNIARNNNDNTSSLSINANGISDRMFNDLENHMSLSTTENVRTIVHSDARTLADSRNSEHENSTRVLLNQWPVKHNAIVEGNLVLGGLMMVHEREDTVTCGPVMAQGGIQALEAMLYTLDWLNERNIVPGVKIGAHILDDCDKDTYGLEMAVDFIKGSISNIDGAEYNCNKTTVRKVISGVVGAASSVTSIQVANLLRLFRIPQVSFFSTSPELSNKQRFEYFTRTIPSDHYQVKAMVDIIIKMGWSYVSIIYEESNYGIKAYEELEDLLGKHQICIAIKEKLVKDSGVAEETAYDNIVQKLLTKPRARGCIIFGSDQEVAGVMRAVRRNNATGAFYWIGSDGWSARGLVSNKNEPEVEGTLSVQPQANPVDGFEDYFLSLTVENNKRNPWFFEFWEDHFQCRYPNTSSTPYNQKYKIPCTTKERLTKHNTAFEDQLQFVSDAVMAFAYAFRDMHADLCHGKAGLCDAMKPTKGTELLKYLRKVEFQGLSGDNFHFDKNGDGPARYNIIHFKQISPGKYKWIRVGKYLEGELRLNMSEIQFRLDNPEAPESVCSLSCRVGQAKKYVEGESCCWHCLDCTQYQIRHATDQTQCVPCSQGTLPDETHSFCREIPEEFLKPDSGWAIGAMSFSASGILITLFVGGVFVKHNDTPIVRASGRELSYVLLIGILMCYLVTFTLVLKPTDIVCGIQRFAAGFCFTVVYAALLTKTNRISRIFNKSKKSAKRPSFISPRSQLIICSLLVGVQILINAVWMVIDPAKARHHYPTREDNLLVCNSYIDASYMIAFSYPIILIIVCTIYAVLTRKIPEDFNESKHIGFTMYTTCIIWLAFVPLYFGTGNHVALRITSMSVTISLSASVTIACLFSPKLYIILIHPERNIRRGRGQFAPKSTTNITRTNASSMISTVTLTAATCDQNKAVKGHTIATTDCSTQSELYEMEIRERKNGKVLQNMMTRSTQTLMNNNGKEINVVISPTIKDINIKDTFGSVRSLNISRIGNGPINQNDGVL